MRFADFPAPWTISDFDFGAQPSIDPALIRELATTSYVDDATKRPVHRATRRRENHAGDRPRTRRQRCRLSGLLHHRSRPRRPLPPGRLRGQMGRHHAVLLWPCRLDHRRARISPHARRRRRSTVPGHRETLSERVSDLDHQPDSWGDIFTDTTIAAAMLDRLLHKSVVFNIDGDSYRLRTHQPKPSNGDPKEQTTGKPIRYSNWRRRVLVPAVAAIGRPEINGENHVFRHTTGALVQREATTQVVQAAMRYSDYSTSFRANGHMQAGITDLAAEAIDRQVAAAGAPTIHPPGIAKAIDLPGR